MRVRRTFSTVLSVIILAATSGFSKDETADKQPETASQLPISPPKETPSKKATITIKADSYSYSENLLKAEGDVSVVDGDMVLTADIMTLKTTRIDDKLTYEEVVALGTTNQVVMKSADGTAQGQKVEYNVIKGVATLSGKPVVTFSDGGSLSGAETIMMDRTKQRIWTVGGTPRAMFLNPKRSEPQVAEAIKPEAMPQEPKAAAPAAKTIPKAPTEVTSKEIIYDMAKGTIEFKGNVHVIDDDMDLKGEALKVFRDTDGTASRIEVSGGDGLVQVVNPEGEAEGPRADYDLKKGVLVLHGDANLRTTGGMVFKHATKVTYYRDKKAFSAKGGTIDITNKQGGTLKDMLKPPPKKTVTNKP